MMGGAGTLQEDPNSVILAALATGPQPNHDQQAATGLGRTSVARRLRTLEERGLVEPTANRKNRTLRWRRTDTSPRASA
jgi:DNA-binding IclR family transcriptional regulator